MRCCAASLRCSVRCFPPTHSVRPASTMRRCWGGGSRGDVWSALLRYGPTIDYLKALSRACLRKDASRRPTAVDALSSLQSHMGCAHGRGYASAGPHTIAPRPSDVAPDHPVSSGSGGPSTSSAHQAGGCLRRTAGQALRTPGTQAALLASRTCRRNSLRCAFRGGTLFALEVCVTFN